MSKRTSKGGYEVGYCKPPKHTQFKPGQSGNPKGRPKIGTTTLSGSLLKVLRQRVRVTVNGKRKSMTKAELFCEHTFNDAMNSNTIGSKKLIFDVVRLAETYEAMLLQQAEEEAARDAPKEPVRITLQLGEMDLEEKHKRMHKQRNTDE